MSQGVGGGDEREGVGELGWDDLAAATISGWRGSRGSNAGVGQTMSYCFEEGKRQQIESVHDFVGNVYGWEGRVRA